MSKIIQYLYRERKTVKSAPLVFIFALILGFATAFAVLDWHYSERMNALVEIANVYKTRLENATPEEAVKEVASLQQRLEEFKKNSGIAGCTLPAIPVELMKPVESEDMLGRMERLLQEDAH